MSDFQNYHQFLSLITDYKKFHHLILIINLLIYLVISSALLSHVILYAGFQNTTHCLLTHGTI